jgi:hypothetical protein
MKGPACCGCVFVDEVCIAGEGIDHMLFVEVVEL